MATQVHKHKTPYQPHHLSQGDIYERLMWFSWRCFQVFYFPGWMFFSWKGGRTSDFLIIEVVIAFIFLGLVLIKNPYLKEIAEWILGSIYGALFMYWGISLIVYFGWFS